MKTRQFLSEQPNTLRRTLFYDFKTFYVRNNFQNFSLIFIKYIFQNFAFSDFKLRQSLFNFERQERSNIARSKQKFKNIQNYFEDMKDNKDQEEHVEKENRT